MKFVHRSGWNRGQVDIPRGRREQAPIVDGVFVVDDPDQELVDQLKDAGHAPLSSDEYDHDDDLEVDTAGEPDQPLEGGADQQDQDQDQDQQLDDAPPAPSSDETTTPTAGDDDVEQPHEQGVDTAVNDEYADMSRPELYESAKNQGYEGEWNESDTETLRRWLRENEAEPDETN